MADIELVIKISQEDYDWIKRTSNGNTCYPCTLRLYDAVKNGTPLPKGHGAIIDLEKVIRVEIEESHTGKKMVWNNNPKINDTTWRMVAPAIIEADKGDKE